MKNQGHPLNLPVMFGFEESGKWYAIDIVKGRLEIGNSDTDEIKRISFLDFARMVSAHGFCYIYPDMDKESQISPILRSKDEMLEDIQDFNVNVYCVENDRTYHMSHSSIYSDGERISTDDLSDSSMYVIDPRLTLKIQKRKNRVF